MKNSRSLLQTFPGAPCHPKHIYHTHKYSLLPTPPPPPSPSKTSSSSTPPLDLLSSPLSHLPPQGLSSAPLMAHPVLHPLHPTPPPLLRLTIPPPSSDKLAQNLHRTLAIPCTHISFLSCRVRRATPHRHLPQPRPLPLPPLHPTLYGPTRWGMGSSVVRERENSCRHDG